MSSEREDPGPEAAAGADALARHGWVLGLVLVGVGLTLRLGGLGEHWLNPDEGIYYSTLTWSSAERFWTEVSANAHPPAFYLVLRWAGALTRDFVVLRVIPLLGGGVAVWLFWLLGRELGGRGVAGVVAGLAAAGLLAVNPEAVLFSQVLRPYMMLVPLLAGALLSLLRYRSEPTRRRLVAYTVLVCLAALTHYSAVLAWVVLLGVVASDFLAGKISGTGVSPAADDVAERAEGPTARDPLELILLAQLVPAALVVLLFVGHLGSAVEGNLVSQALAPGGWLSAWLFGSVADAWRGFTGFQIFHLPPGFEGRSALLTLGAVVMAVLMRERLVAVLGVGALAVALIASFAGLYPFGPTRHSLWIVVFTLPVVGWMVGRLVVAGRKVSLGAAAALAVMLALGGPIETLVGAGAPLGSAADEQAVRRADLEPVLDLLDPGEEPEAILMSFQTFNMLMPLYAAERERLQAGSSSELFGFAFGSRRVAVVGEWDWAGLDQVRRTLRQLPTRLPGVVPERPERALVLAGGWDSSLLGSTSALEAAGALVDSVVVTGRNAAGDPIPRMAAWVVNVESLLGSG